MKKQPLVSVIIPTYNRAQLIGETLDSVLAQTYQYWECIIVDDGSTDNTYEVVCNYTKKDSRFKYFKRPNKHLSCGNGARNYGFKMSKGEYVNWFDDDDLMKKNFLELKVNCLKKDLDVVFCYGAYFRKKSEFCKARHSKPKSIKLNPLTYVKHIFHIHIAGPLWKKSFLKSKKLYDEKRKKLQDVEFHFRMILNSPKYYFYNDTNLYYIRLSKNSISRSKLNTEKKLDIFTYHYKTFKSANLVESKIRICYKNYTRVKLLKTYYFLMVNTNGLKNRLNLGFRLLNEIRDIIKEESNFFKKIRSCFVILIITISKKGLRLIK